MHAIVYDYEKYFGNDYLKCITLNFNSTELFNFYEILFRLLKYKNGVIVIKITPKILNHISSFSL